MARKRTPAQVAADSRRTGRPPKPPTERRTERMVVRLTREEKAKLEGRAGKAGLPLSTYILHLLQEKGQ